MSLTHISWSSIELFHNVVRTLNHLHDLGTPLPSLWYRAKVKLHGTNCAIQVTPAGVFAQSRTGILSLPSNDYKGFASWVKTRESAFAALTPGITIFGEWCGPGVEKGMAVSALKGKLFAVFGIQVGYGADAKVIYDPDEIAAMLPKGVPDLYVLPWEGSEFSVDFRYKEDMERVVTFLNKWVDDVEHEDPWIKRTFGTSGLGEGLVFYPTRNNDGTTIPTDPTELALLMFKAKGEKHRTAGTPVPVQVDATVVESVDEFVKLMVTEARLTQGLSTVCPDGPDIRATGKYLAWVSADVEKESKAELEASGLTWEQVSKAVQAKARDWFKASATA
jgi:hypothetical protein